MGEFKVGDLVELKSGGPVMTIKEVFNDPEGAEAQCEWFDNIDVKQHLFVMTSLKPAG